MIAFTNNHVEDTSNDAKPLKETSFEKYNYRKTKEIFDKIMPLIASENSEIYEKLTDRLVVDDKEIEFYHPRNLSSAIAAYNSILSKLYKKLGKASNDNQ